MGILDTMAASPLPSLTGAEASAEQLVALAHGCVDWDVWGGARAIRYWDALTDRVRTCCYAGPRLADWWEAMTRRMSLHQPRSVADRAAVAGVLASDDGRPILTVLAGNAEALVLRVRVAVESAREGKTEVAVMPVTAEYANNQEGML